MKKNNLTLLNQIILAPTYTDDSLYDVVGETRDSRQTDSKETAERQI